MLAASHPSCPAQQGIGSSKTWSIASVSGKCTEERLANAKATVTTPKTVTLVSQLQLPDLIEDCSSKGTLLVVICLATFAQEASSYANLLAEKVNAEFCQKYKASGNSPVRMVAIELAEAKGFSETYKVKEVPYCLMFQGGTCVYSKRLSTTKFSLRDTYLARPRVLLVEENHAFQLKIARILRRSSYENDLATDGSNGVRLASRGTQHYGILMASARLRADLLRSIVQAVRRLEPNALIIAYDAGGGPCEGDDPEARKQFLDECSHVFPYLPSYTSLAAIFARHDIARPTYQHVGHSKQDFVDEIVQVIGSTGAGGGAADTALAMDS
jgi:hypothetical protein